MSQTVDPTNFRYIYNGQTLYYIQKTNTGGAEAFNGTRVEPEVILGYWPKIITKNDYDSGWEQVEDHRKRVAGDIIPPEAAQEATDFWLPGDTWDASARHMTEIGPLPDGAMLEAPERPLADIQEEALRVLGDVFNREIIRGVTGVISTAKVYINKVQAAEDTEISFAYDSPALYGTVMVEFANALPGHVVDWNVDGLGLHVYFDATLYNRVYSWLWARDRNCRNQLEDIQAQINTRTTLAEVQGIIDALSNPDSGTPVVWPTTAADFTAFAPGFAVRSLATEGDLEEAELRSDGFVVKYRVDGLTVSIPAGGSRNIFDYIDPTQHFVEALNTGGDTFTFNAGKMYFPASDAGYVDGHIDYTLTARIYGTQTAGSPLVLRFARGDGSWSVIKPLGSQLENVEGQQLDFNTYTRNSSENFVIDGTTLALENDNLLAPATFKGIELVVKGNVRRWAFEV